MLKCPICDTPLAEHGDKPCLHAWYAALRGEWVAYPHAPWPGMSSSKRYRPYYWVEGSTHTYRPCYWKLLTYYNTPKHVWAILVELLDRGYLIGTCGDHGPKKYCVTDDHDDAPIHILGLASTPELAVLKAGIAMEGEKGA